MKNCYEVILDTSIILLKTQSNQVPITLQTIQAKRKEIKTDAELKFLESK